MTQSGFTLIEILIALLVIAIALSVGLRSAILHTNNAAYLRDHTFAHWVALNKVAELRLQRQWIALGDDTGRQIQGGIQWHWKTQIIKTIDPDLRKVEVHVMHTLSDPLPLQPKFSHFV